MQITHQDLTNIIQTIKKGIDDSELGPLYVYGDLNAHGNPTKVYSPVAFEAFKIMLSGVMTKMGQVDLEPLAPPSALDISDVLIN